MKKHISDMNDKEFDDFLRNRLSDVPHIDYHEGDWEAMRRLLDKGETSTSGGWGSKHIIGLVLVLISAALIWYSIGYLNSTDLVTESNPEKSFPGTSIRSDMSVPDNFILPVTAIIRKNEPPGIQKNIREDKAYLPVTPDDTAQGHKTYIADKKIYTGVSAPSLDKMIQKVHEHQNATMKSGRNLGTEPHAVRIEPVSRPIPSQKTLSFAPTGRFSVSLMVAPDISAIKLNRMQNPGRSIAFSLEYFFHPRWSLNSGLIHAYKTYEGGEGYRVNYQPSPVGLKGDCWIIDVPANVRFYALDVPKQRFFLSTGVSSYFMLREKYDLFYSAYGGNNYTEKVETKAGGNHYFNIINFGVGYERRLGNRLAFQAEPYFKLPIQGIGQGDLSLKSFGVFLGLKYYR